MSSPSSVKMPDGNHQATVPARRRPTQHAVERFRAWLFRTDEPAWLYVFKKRWAIGAFPALVPACLAVLSGASASELEWMDLSSLAGIRALAMRIEWAPGWFAEPSKAGARPAGTRRATCPEPVRSAPSARSAGRSRSPA